MAEKKKNLHTPNLCFWIWVCDKNTRPADRVYGLTSIVSGTLGLTPIIVKRKKSVKSFKLLGDYSDVQQSQWAGRYFCSNGFKIYFVYIFLTSEVSVNYYLAVLALC